MQLQTSPSSEKMQRQNIYIASEVTTVWSYRNSIIISIITKSKKEK